MKTYWKSQGAALITALFIMTLVAIAATAMNVNLEMSIRRTELTVTSIQLYNAAEGVQDWAEGILLDDAAKITPSNQTVDKIPQHFGPIVQNGITITGQLLDAQSCFNLNNLTNPSAISQFVLLLQAVNPSLGQQQLASIANAVAAWITNPGSVKSSSQYMEIYSKMNPPYQASFMPMVSTSELRLVAGITQQLYQQLVPYVTALPSTTPININTTSAPVLMSLANGISREQANAFITSRPPTGFQNATALNANGIFQQMNISDNKFTLLSNYFLAIATVKKGPQHLVLYTLIQRQQIKNQWQISTIWQAQGDY